jgi:hypothetical protein
MVRVRTSHASTTGPPGSGGAIWHTYAPLHGEACHSPVGANPSSGGRRTVSLHLRRIVTLGRSSASDDASEVGLAHAALHPGSEPGFLARLSEFWNRWGDRIGDVPRFGTGRSG